MNNREFWQTFLLSALDKLVLGALLFLLGFFVQEAFKAHQRAQELTLSVSRVHTDVVAEQRVNLVRNVGQYLGLLDGLKFKGKAEAKQGVEHQLSKTRQEIELAIFQVSGLYPEFQSEAKPLRDAVLLANEELFSGKTLPPEEVEDHAQSVRTKFSTALVALRSVSMRAMATDQDAVTAFLDKPTVTGLTRGVTPRKGDLGMAEEIRVPVAEVSKLLEQDQVVKLIEISAAYADPIQQSVDVFVALFWPMVSAFAAVGVLAMALIEVYKSILNPRSKFQKERFAQFLSDWARRAPTMDGHTTPDGKNALDKLVILAIAGDQDALFELSPDRLTGQLNAAVRIVLAYPQKYPDIILTLAHQAGAADLGILLAKPPDASDTAKTKEYLDAKTRIASLMQRALDAVQIVLANSWAKRMHWAAVSLSCVLILASSLVFYAFTSVSFQQVHLVPWIVVAVIGGMAAPIAHDLVSTLKDLRKRAR